MALPELSLAPGLKIDAFGVLSTVGTLIGAVLALRAARRYAPGDEGPLRELAPWAIAGGLLGGHLFHLLAYHPEELQRGGVLQLLRVWDGLSSMGGVLGGLAATVYFFHRKKLALRPYLDALALGVAPGWAVARVGCFGVHDHPGVRTDFFLAVAFPGGARHDLGLYDALLLFALTAVLYLLAKKNRAPGSLMALLAIGYAVARFFLDFLRARDLAYVDRRYWGLTPAQYVAFGLIAVGLWLLATSGAQKPNGSCRVSR